MKPRQYIAIDLKSFYASVECVERGLDPLDACLVVADESRTEKTICLAVSPALKTFGTGGRPRLFEVIQCLREVNRRRSVFSKSTSLAELTAHPEISVDYIVAPPRMGLYLKYSAKIYSIYLRYIAPEDIHVYSIDEVFIDVTDYLKTYRMSAHRLAIKMIREVLNETGVTATAGIGTNLYLCKVAMDIVAKKIPPDKDGVRIAGLDERSYREKLWSHRPLTDFWRVGRGIAARLAPYGIFTMGDIARCSMCNEDFLYRLFGVNAELLIDHAWGWEPVTMPYIKAYRPETHSMSSGQVLHEPYSFAKARVVMLEMADTAALKLLDKRLVTDHIGIYVGYDRENLLSPEIRAKYHGPVTTDHYGRSVPKSAHGGVRLSVPTLSSEEISAAAAAIFDKVVNPDLLVRRITIDLGNLVPEQSLRHHTDAVQLSLFADYDKERQRAKERERKRQKERKTTEAVLRIRKKFGKSAILRGLNYAEGATQKERNGQIGGHKE